MLGCKVVRTGQMMKFYPELVMSSSEITLTELMFSYSPLQMIIFIFKTQYKSAS